MTERENDIAAGAIGLAGGAGGAIVPVLATRRLAAVSSLQLAATVVGGAVGTASLAGLLIFYARWRRAKKQRKTISSAVRHKRAVDELVHMGLSVRDADAAAKRCHNDVDAAMQWAVQCGRRGGAAAVLLAEVSRCNHFQCIKVHKLRHRLMVGCLPSTPKVIGFKPTGYKPTGIPK